VKKYTLPCNLSHSNSTYTCHCIANLLLTTVVGRRPQGILQGLFSASGSVARVSFPVMAGYVVSYRNIETLFVILCFVLGVSVVFVVAARDTLTRLAT